MTTAPGALAGLRVVELATVLAGPGAGRHLADFGADVIKIESPGRPDGTRAMGWRDVDGVTMFWKLVARGKRTIELDLKDPDDLGFMFDLCETADVLIENLRPGKLEALGLTPDALHRRNPKLVICRVTGFGQTGPYANRPGFATLAEAMSGFASINGATDGPPELPPVALADEITAIIAGFATMVALRSGVGQVVDVNLLESMLQMMGALPSAVDKLGYSQPRLGSGIPYSVPRSTYRTSDDRWLAISTSAESVAARVMDLVGLGDDPRFSTFGRRVEHREEIDEAVGAWVAARTLDEALAGFEEVEAAAAAVLTMAETMADPHVVARNTFVEVDGVKQIGPLARLSATPGSVRWGAREQGADTEQVRAEVARLLADERGRRASS